MFDQETTNRRRSGGLREISARIFRYAPIAGYLGAQIIVVGAWAWRVRTLGIAESHEQGEVIGAFFIAAVFSLLPALILGVLDGIARALDKPILRAVIAILLILLSWKWILMWGTLAAGTQLFSNEVVVPSLPVYFGVLAGMEIALISEWALAIVISATGSALKEWLRWPCTKSRGLTLEMVVGL